MRNPEGESDRRPLRPCFDRRLKLEFHGSRFTSDAGLLAYRELDDTLGLTALASNVLADSRTGKNGWHDVVGLLRQSVYGRLAGYEDVNDADRLGRDPAMRWIVGGKAVERGGASTSQMSRFETELLSKDENLTSLADLSGLWIDRVHDRRAPVKIILDMDSSVSPTYGDQEGTAYNGHFGCTCYHLCSCSISLATWSDVAYVPATFTVPMDGATFWSRWWNVTRPRRFGSIFAVTRRLPRRTFTNTSKPRAFCMRSAFRPTRFSSKASPTC